MSTAENTKQPPGAASAHDAPAAGETALSRSLSRARLWWEIAIVLGLSLGQSAVYAIVQLIGDLTAPTPISQQTASLNSSQSPVQWQDFTYQFLDVVFELVPVALAIYLLWRPGQSAFHRIGLSFHRFGRATCVGVLLTACIGIPGLALYAVGRLIGITIQVQASPLESYWWTVPVLLLSALRAALQEEVIVVGYLFSRLRELSWRSWTIIVAAAVLRGSYHLYQGVGAFVGNAIMGIVFGWVYTRWGRTTPLVIAHFLLDAISFVGYPLAVTWWPAIFR